MKPKPRNIRITVNPSLEKEDTVYACGWPVHGNTNVSVLYKNTEVCITFKKDNIIVSTYDAILSDINASQTKTFNYTKNKQKPDISLGDQFHVQLDIPAIKEIPEKASMKHCIIIKKDAKKNRHSC